MLLVASAAHAVTRVPARCQQRPAVRLCAIHWHHTRVNQIRFRLGLRAVPYHWLAEQHPARRARILTYWLRVHRRSLARLHAAQQAPWLRGTWYQDALCVHHFEGSWTDPGAPYWGGMQMDLSFQQAYGPRSLARYGTADNWPVGDQLHAAYRAWLSRGWSPWPNTARMCGLL